MATSSVSSSSAALKPFGASSRTASRTCQKTCNNLETGPAGALEPLSAAAPWAIFPRKKLDVTYGDVAAGLRACFALRESERAACERRLTQHWDPSGHSMVTLSVRCERECDDVPALVGTSCRQCEVTMPCWL